MVAVLIIFSLGATVASACGPIELVMQLTGAQNSLLKIVLVVNTAGLAVMALGAHLFGPLGAAVCIAATVATWNIAAVIAARRRVHIDSSVLGVFR
jgi:O-antigen/teichoic acid export membrane protein